MYELANERNNSLSFLKTVKYLKTLNMLNVKQVTIWHQSNYTSKEQWTGF